MNRHSVSAALGILAIAATSYAAGTTSQTWASGKLNRFDPTAKTVVIMQGTHEMTFSLAPTARLMLGKATLQPSDLTSDVGKDVKIRYMTKGTSKVADRVEVLGAATPRTAKK